MNTRIGKETHETNRFQKPTHTYTVISFTTNGQCSAVGGNGIFKYIVLS